MTRTKRVIVLSVLFTIGIASAIGFVSCGDNDTKIPDSIGNNLSKSGVNQELQQFISIFQSEPFYHFNNDELDNYVANVSEVTGVDIVGLSNSNAMSQTDEIISECLMNYIETHGLSVRLRSDLQANTQALQLAMENEDSIAAQSALAWFSRLINCEFDFDNYDLLHIREYFLHQVALCGDIDKKLKTQFPKIFEFDMETQLFIRSLADYYRGRSTENLPVQYCASVYNASIASAKQAYWISVAVCAVASSTFFGGLICLAAAQSFYIRDCDNAVAAYKTCINS